MSSEARTLEAAQVILGAIGARQSLGQDGPGWFLAEALTPDGDLEARDGADLGGFDVAAGAVLLVGKILDDLAVLGFNVPATIGNLGRYLSTSELAVAGGK